MKGRKPKPTQLRVIEGNREHRTIHPEFEPTPASTKPPKPKFLSPPAKKHWNYLVKHLGMMNILGASDQGAIMAAAMSFGEVQECQEEIARIKKIEPRGANEIKAEVACWKACRQAMRDLVKFEAELGLNPTARTRIKLDKPKPQSKKERLLG